MEKDLELARAKLEIARVTMAKNEMEFKLLELEHEMARVRDAMKKQDEHADNVRERISAMEKQGE